eukprot:6175695-Pleurochrysis_carterae.AAC.1
MRSMRLVPTGVGVAVIFLTPLFMVRGQPSLVSDPCLTHARIPARLCGTLVTLASVSSDDHFDNSHPRSMCMRIRSVRSDL